MCDNVPSNRAHICLRRYVTGYSTLRCEQDRELQGNLFEDSEAFREVLETYDWASFETASLQHRLTIPTSPSPSSQDLPGRATPP